MQQFDVLRALEEGRKEARADSSAGVERAVETINGIDYNPPIDFTPVLDALAKVDVNPVVDLQPVVDAVGKFDVKAAVRPMMDVVKVGLTQIEHMKLQAELGPVLDAIQKVDQKIMEAIVRTDAEHIPDLKRNL